MASLKVAILGIAVPRASLARLTKSLKILIFSPVVALVATAAAARQPAVQPFGDLISHVHEARFAEYLGQAGANVESGAAFAEMQTYLEGYYAGVTPVRSIAVGDQIVDCIPVMQQPALRHSGAIATPPPDDFDSGSSSSGAVEASPNAREVTREAHGGGEHCSAGTIPLRRITLDEMVTFKTLEGFFRKEPGDSAIHEYAIATQTVDNWGGNAALNLWKTTVNQNQGEDTSMTALGKAANDDLRSLSSMVEKILTEYLREHGYLTQPKKGGKRCRQ